jgi:hypothetical protein
VLAPASGFCVRILYNFTVVPAFVLTVENVAPSVARSSRQNKKKTPSELLRDNRCSMVHAIHVVSLMRDWLTLTRALRHYSVLISYFRKYFFRTLKVSSAETVNGCSLVHELLCVIKISLLSSTEPTCRHSGEILVTYVCAPIKSISSSCSVDSRVDL